MSDQYNDIWLENAKEWFEESLETANYAHARAIVTDLKENGFSEQAVVLERELVDKQNEQ